MRARVVGGIGKSNETLEGTGEESNGLRVSLYLHPPLCKRNQTQTDGYLSLLGANSYFVFSNGIIEIESTLTVKTKRNSHLN